MKYGCARNHISVYWLHAQLIANGWPLATPDQNTTYGGDDEGYITYPSYEG